MDKGKISYQRVFALNPGALDLAVEAHVHGARLFGFHPGIGVVVDLAVMPAPGYRADGDDGRVAAAGLTAISADDVPGIAAVLGAKDVWARHR